MTATLSFSLPEEDAEHQTALDGQKWKTIVSDFDEKLRRDLKYGKLNPDCYALAEDMRRCLHQWLAEENLSLD